jgi:hypothetical protein
MVSAQIYSKTVKKLTVLAKQFASLLEIKVDWWKV